jgi:hypothetical protein
MGSHYTLVTLTGVGTDANNRRMQKQANLGSHRILVAIFLASTVAFSGAQSAPPQSSQNPSKPAPAPVWQGSQLNRLSHRAEMYYENLWGVGELHVKETESGEIIRFNYRVVDPEKATVLNDKKVEPELIDSQAGVKLAVPQMEKVGQLRQSSTPKAGMVYWMAFSNPTRAVKRGHRVDIVIGTFKANGLVVE